MALTLDSETALLREQAFEFFGERAPVAALRKLRDDKDPVGFSRPLWREMAALGWAGFLVPEDYEGSAFGLVGLGQVMEAAGRTLAATPLLSTALIGASALTLAGSATQQATHLPPLAKGERITALALEEGAHHAPFHIATTAKRNGNGFRLDGEKRFVLDGHVADLLIVAARTSGGAAERRGITMFLVPGGAQGLSRRRTFMVDSRNAATIRFEGVELGADAVLGPIDEAADVLDALLDRARAGLAAEMLGSASEAFERTVQYLKDRKQFGVPIGSFQALQHRMADMVVEHEQAKSMAVLAALSADLADAKERRRVISAAKVQIGKSGRFVGQQSIQLHGGIGMTEEYAAGHYFKRLTMIDQSFGDADHHLDRFAEVALPAA